MSGAGHLLTPLTRTPQYNTVPHSTLVLGSCSLTCRADQAEWNSDTREADDASSSDSAVAIHDTSESLDNAEWLPSSRTAILSDISSRDSPSIVPLDRTGYRYAVRRSICLRPYLRPK